MFLPGLPRPLHLIEHQGAVPPNLQGVLARRTVGSLDTAYEVLQGRDEGHILRFIVSSRRELQPLDLAATGCGRNLVAAARLCIGAAVVPGAPVEDDQVVHVWPP
jgi:hypothetical protein